MGHLSLGRWTTKREALHRAVAHGCVAGSFVKVSRGIADVHIQ